MNTLEILLLFAFISLLFGIGIAGTYYDTKKAFYKKGQVDAISGDIKYKLVEFADGERKWYHVDDLKDLEDHKVID